LPEAPWFKHHPAEGEHVVGGGSELVASIRFEPTVLRWKFEASLFQLGDCVGN
jgi:hypothetical protein